MRPALPLLFLILAALVARADEAENLRRLEAMPLEQRVYLSEVLGRFDGLPTDEKAAVRALDAAISKLDPAVQARYRALLRRYHVWAQRLDDDKKKQLADAGSAEARLALVRQWRKAERDADTKAKAGLILGVHAGDLGTIPPFEMANALRVWFHLEKKEQDRIENQEKNTERFRAIRSIGGAMAKQKKITIQRLPAAEEDALRKRLEDDPRVKRAFGKYLMSAQEKKADAVPSKGPQPARPDATKAERKADASLLKSPFFLQPDRYDPLHQLAEALYFIEHPPDRVAPENLIRFEAMIPGWLRATLDPLPPDDARRRIEILYRQLYPLPEEVPKPAKAQVPKPKEPPKAPAPKGGDASGVPF